MDNKQSNLLICIYTCKAHEGFHAEFHQSRIGRQLDSFTNNRQIYVYADPALPKSKLDEDRLIVNTVESYSNLCLKTFKMIQACANMVDFDLLMKIDLTSGIREFNTDQNIVNRVSDDQPMIDHLENLKRSLESGRMDDYVGWKKITANRMGVERWAKLKNLKIDYEKLLGDTESQTYYSGKCYTVSRKFAEFIRDHGEPLAAEQTKYLPGEDMMIGRLYDFFRPVPD